jgi:hypothetical protein
VCFRKTFFPNSSHITQTVVTGSFTSPSSPPHKYVVQVSSWHYRWVKRLSLSKITWMHYLVSLGCLLKPSHSSWPCSHFRYEFSTSWVQWFLSFLTLHFEHYSEFRGGSIGAPGITFQHGQPNTPATHLLSFQSSNFAWGATLQQDKCTVCINSGNSFLIWLNEIAVPTRIGHV